MTGARFGAALLLLFALAAIFAGAIARYDPDEQHPGGVTEVFAAPCQAHWLGTDDRGRDVAARLVYGARAALAVGLLAVSLAFVAGVTIGLLCALGGADFVFGRVIEVGLLFPTILVLLAIAGLRGGTSLGEVVIAIALTQWPNIARLTRAEALRLVAAPHIEAARALGAGPVRVLFVHVMPLAVAPALVAAAFGVGHAVLLEAALGFLGLSLPPPTATWGELLLQAQASGYRWSLLAPATLAITLLVLSCNLVGDGVRRALQRGAKAA